MSMRVVILGGGYGGAYCAQALLRRARRSGIDVTLIDRHNYFIFYPLLVEAGTGSIEPRHTVVPIRDFLPRGEFRMAEIEAIDTDARTVRYLLIGGDRATTIEYDHLVLALGSVTRMPDVPGVRERCFRMKSLIDAVRLRDRAVELLELANATEDPEVRRELLHFVVVGGNFTGVEVAGEFDEFLRRAQRGYAHVGPDECRVTLVELGDRILAPLSPELSRFAEGHLRRRGVDIHLKSSVREVEARRAILTSGEPIATRTVIWCAGIAPSPLIRACGLPHDGQGYVRCDRDLRVQGVENVWAIGDCAVNLDQHGRPYPATAQHAVRQGRVLARNLERVAAGQPTKPCDLASHGTLAALGCRTGVAQVFGIRISGFAAWWLWRTVYLLKMPRLGRKLRVAFAWTLDLFFTRDHIQLGVHRDPRA